MKNRKNFVKFSAIFMQREQTILYISGANKRMKALKNLL